MDKLSFNVVQDDGLVKAAGHNLVDWEYLCDSRNGSHSFKAKMLHEGKILVGIEHTDNGMGQAGHCNVASCGNVAQ